MASQINEKTGRASLKDKARLINSSTLAQEYSRRSILLEEVLGQSPEEILRRTLSTGTAVATASSSAQRMDLCRPPSPETQLAFRDIGRGSCGSIFEVPGAPYAIKKGSNVAAIWNDFNLTNLAYNSHIKCLFLFRDDFPNHQVPRSPLARFFNSPESSWWETNMSCFPEADRVRAAAFHLDRILPVTKETREAIVQTYFEPDRSTQRQVLSNIDNKDCLVRVYFGENSPSDELYDSSDTLRNFPLYVDRAQELKLDIDKLAEEMALGLAVLHWEAQIDTQDVEFVIGTSTTTVLSSYQPDHRRLPPPVSTFDDFGKREIQMWMLDFDKATQVALSDTDIVQKYFVAVTGNDPYFPHPQLNLKLWQTFSQAYLQASKVILKTKRVGNSMLELPGMLIQRWELWGVTSTQDDEDDPFERGTDYEEDEEDFSEATSEDEDDDSGPEP
ncbi:hypothetical protein PV08_07706 [Exophiala spinifera]|uniref:DUF3669 domain-containing protein n=1 Tax=Exophiala spinifera TaxID=91928 RepID=A0A0D1YJ08_9EURO|nr:uncharacterized protein PV08_07706 [Exophiala spinifera]KIW14921.1 hypothetical protein PV08_07706 [Exophiala spinifera]